MASWFKNVTIELMAITYDRKKLTGERPSTSSAEAIDRVCEDEDCLHVVQPRNTRNPISVRYASSFCWLISSLFMDFYEWNVFYRKKRKSDFKVPFLDLTYIVYKTTTLYVCFKHTSHAKILSSFFFILVNLVYKSLSLSLFSSSSSPFSLSFLSFYICTLSISSLT